MNKAQLIEEVAKKTHLSIKDAENAVSATIDAIKKNIKKGIQLICFYSFSISKCKVRTIKNAHTGKTIKIKTVNLVKFKEEFKNYMQIYKKRYAYSCSVVG